MLSFIIAALIRFSRWRRYRRNLKVLAVLDDRTLRDIGIGRSELWRAALKGRHD